MIIRPTQEQIEVVTKICGHLAGPRPYFFAVKKRHGAEKWQLVRGHYHFEAPTFRDLAEKLQAAFNQYGFR